MSDPVVVYLQGGLGNQLFQLSYGLHVSGGRPVKLVGVPGFTQHGQDDVPSILDLDLPDGVHYSHNVSRSAIARARGLARLSREAQAREGLRQRASEAILRAAGSRGYRVDVVTHSLYGGGTLTSPKYVLGFWQSWTSAESLRRPEVRPQIRINAMSRPCRVLIETAMSQMPVMVHVRLGDYLEIPAYGIPSPGYYAEALDRLDASRARPIWVFSDDASRAKTYLSQTFIGRGAFFPELEFGTLSAAEVLAIMWHGSAYVMGNSTLSWWGAFLSHQVRSPVVTPRPWFRSAKVPEELIPPEWAPASIPAGYT